MGGPVFEGSPETDWDQMGVFKPLSGDPMEKLSAELVVDTHIKVGNPGLFVPVKILIDSGSRVPILFRRNLFQNLTPARRPIKMCTATNSPLPGGSMGAVVSMTLPIAFSRRRRGPQRKEISGVRLGI